MPVDFPTAPANGAVYSFGGRTWTFNGTAWVPEQTVLSPDKEHGQVYAVPVNATSCRIDPEGGGNILIDGVVRKLTAPLTVTINSTNVPTAGLIYYVYLYWTGSAIAAEVASTLPVVDASGISIKNGDASRTLVAVFFASAIGNIQTAASDIGFLSFFNRKLKRAFLQHGLLTTTSGTPAILSYQNALQWGDEATVGLLTGTQYSNTSGLTPISWIGVNGSAQGHGCNSYCPAANALYPMSCHVFRPPQGGVDYPNYNIVGQSNGTATAGFYGNLSLATMG